MSDLRAPFETVPTLEKFSNYLQLPTNKTFYYEWGNNDTSEICADDEEEDEEGIQEKDEETANEEDLPT